GEGEVERISRVSKAMKGLALECGVPVIGVSQLSRQVESRPDKRPLLSDLRQSGQLEQDADQVWMLYRDEYYNPASKDRG
ncbi:DnaB-like helicase C-terminal domain-containing protein, partial [Acinetobacter baumannii]